MVVGNFIQELETIVIGGGPGGYVAAIRLAQLGKKVTLFEKNKVGGTCLHCGCIPSKALISVGHQYENTKNTSRGIKADNVTIDFSLTQQWKNEEVIGLLHNGVKNLLKKNGVEVVYGEVNFVNDNTVSVILDEFHNNTYHFKNAIIATGTEPIEIKGFKFKDRILSSTEVLNLTEIPSSLVVIGGGYIGIELAGAYATLGTKVTILEGTDKILRVFEDDIANVVINNLKSKGVEIITNAHAENAESSDTSALVNYSIGNEKYSISADYVLVSVGRKPNFEELGLEYAGIELDSKGLIRVDEQRRTTVKHIFAIGDIVPGPTLAHKAMYEAKIAAEALVGDSTAVVDYFSIPTVCFTTPEIALVGYTKEQAKEHGYDVVVGQYPFGHNGRALSIGQNQGFVRIIALKDTNKLLGAAIVGPGASDLIAELSIAIEQGLTVDDISLTIHGHPSLNEVVVEAADMILKKAIHG
ncbi:MULTISPECIES: dihydrolipoyl dehydrogenase [Gemella]|uniref:dihydrolipoyl dehydrogenase n=1 Tax=Gemella TaxID=1378 RepID=UPI00092FDCC5|nr:MULTISPECIES: dihydrolipoyl dehydrogenase [Gemella]AXI27152.1 dihydrolipoyl dehydrogenase [Gemella sp. ND 6198]